MDSQDSKASDKGSSLVCLQCHLPKRSQHSGSLTSWVFVSRTAAYCTCAEAIIRPSTLSATGTLTRKIGKDLRVLREQSSAHELSMPDLSENLVRGFSFSRKLGQGIAGSVYLARDNATGEEVAIKLLTTDTFFDGGTERFDQQAVAMSASSIQIWCACAIMGFLSMECLT